MPFIMTKIVSIRFGVYDLERGSNDSSIQMANYEGIANWFNSRTSAEQNLIADGRIRSSTRSQTIVSETPWIQNYALQLQASGGGLVLGTDHASKGRSSGAFVDGINQINTLIGINPFRNEYIGSEALVDPESPLFLDGLASCRNSPDDSCIRSVTSTGYAPAGEQPGGLFLTPAAFHGTNSSAFENAAVSSTFGSPTFPKQTVPEPSAFLGLLAISGLGWSMKRQKA